MRRLLFLFALTLPAQQRPPVMSIITIVSADGTGERTVASLPQVYEAPNWSPDGKYLVLNSGGKLYRLAVGGGQPEEIPTGAVTKLNNDHGISPDGTLLAVSAGQIYVLPFAGGEPRAITNATPSYFHGWSPDGRTLAYCAKRGENFDLYGISVKGGAEQRLTSHPGYDDGPDYSPDGKYIYFNSDRSGSWDIWRIPASGAGPDDSLAERITNDDQEDWFPHPSPDGKRMVFLSFEKGTKGHPPNKRVQIRMLELSSRKLLRVPVGRVGREPVVLKTLFGGQGTMNVNSWSPDSKQFAYVRYSLLPW